LYHHYEASLNGRVAYLRLLAGILFILAGLSAYYGVSIDAAMPLVLIAAGVALILIVLVRLKPKGGDVALFLIGLLTLGFTASGMDLAVPSQTVTYSALRGQVDVDRIHVDASAEFGSIDILFSNDDDTAYMVEFSRPFALPAFQRGGFDFSNRTEGGVLFLNATSSFADIKVTVGRGYMLSVEASTGMGSIGFKAPRSGVLEIISLSAGTGSIDADISSEVTGGIRIRTGTGSIDMNSDQLTPVGANIPVSISTGTGSVDFDVKIPRSAAVRLTASVALGSISHSLEGFKVSEVDGGRLKATAGEPSTADESFEISISTGTGSIDIDAEWSG